MKQIYTIELHGITGAAWDISETFFRKMRRLISKLPDIFTVIDEDELTRQGIFKLMMDSEELICIYGRLIIIRTENVIQMKEDNTSLIEREFLNSAPKEKYLLAVESIQGRDKAYEKSSRKKKDI